MINKNVNKSVINELKIFFREIKRVKMICDKHYKRRVINVKSPLFIFDSVIYERIISYEDFFKIVILNFFRSHKYIRNEKYRM